MSTNMTGVWVFLIAVLLGLTGVSAAPPQDIEWEITDELPHSLRPADGMMYPGEMKLAGPRTISEGEPFRCWLRAVPPALLGTYDGVCRKPDMRPELIVELRNAQGKVLSTQRPSFSEATLLKGGHPAYYDVVWQALPLAARGLPRGEYVVVATMMVEGRIPFNRVEKRLRVLSPDAAKRARSQELTPQALARAAGPAVMKIEGAVPGAPGEAVLLPAGKSLQVAMPGKGRVVVYGLAVAPSPEFTATVGGTTRQVPAVKDAGYLLRERFLGIGQGGADKLQIEAKSGPLRLAGVRVDVFLPLVPFYEAARGRRRRVELADQPVMVWDAESLAVFKMMFFRRKDLADVEQILRAQGARFDRLWVREQLAGMYGPRDPRLSQWDELTEEVPVEWP